VGGGPHNPYDVTRSASGSSSGPGIAAAMSFAAATVGTETSGSVVSPASFMGLVGMKPSIALVSRRGIVPISLTQDTAGPMARSVTDAAMPLTVMAGSDAADPWSRDADAHKVDYVHGLDAGSLKGAKLGVLRGLSGYSDDTAAVFDRALAVLKAQGAELVEIPNSLFEDLSQEQRLVLLYDFKEDINHYLASTPPSVKTRTLTELIAFDKADAHERMHANDIFEVADQTQGGRQNPEYRKTLEYAQRRAGPEGIDRALQSYGVRALVVLTGGAAERIVPDGQPQPHYPLAKFPKGEIPPDMTTYAAVAGYPHLTVPMGLVHGLPLGLSFIGTKWTEQELLSLGYAYEQAAHARVPVQSVENPR
jgi:amidase